MIQLRNINKIYGEHKTNRVHALKDVNLIINQGDFISVQGPSGCGKTTLLNLLGLIDRPTSGELIFLDAPAISYQDAQLSRLRNEEIGFVLQDFALIQSESVLFNIILPLIINGKVSKKTMKDRAGQLLSQLKIEELKHKKVSELSGGQKQRVAIARALVSEPRLILADEPTGSLDQDNSMQVMELLRERLTENEITLIVVTHNPEIAKLAKRQIRMIDGSIISDQLC